MNKKTQKTIFILFPLILVAAFYFGGKFPLFGGAAVNPSPSLRGETITVYKTSTCGCCNNYVSYLKREGFEVEAVDVNNMNSIKAEYKIPHGLGSCHTSIIGDYVVEGHVPAESITKLLEEKPDIAGIALSGMPSGSPGMPGFSGGNFPIHMMSHQGEDAGLYE